MAKMTLKVKVNDPIFNINREYPMMHVWYKFGDSSDDLSCRQGKVYGRTDGQTDGLTQATTIPLQPERSRVKTA